MAEQIVRLRLKYANEEHEIQGVGEEQGGYLVISKDDKVSGRYALDKLEYWSNGLKGE